jgi:hypothetical protein
MIFSSVAAFSTASASVLSHPGNILVHPVLEAFLAVWADVPSFVKQSLLCMDKRFGLAERRHIQIGKNIAEVLLGHGRADRPDKALKIPAGLPFQALSP